MTLDKFAVSRNPVSFQAPVFLRSLARRLGRVEKWLIPLTILTAACCAVLTYATLTAAGEFGRNSNSVLWLLDADLVVLLMVLGIIGQRLVRLVGGWRRGVAGSKLHVRLVLIFSVLAAAPAILMTIFSALFLHVGVESWFNTRVRTAVIESQAVAEAYLEEHKQVIRADTLAMASDLDRAAPLLAGNKPALDDLIDTQSLLRNLSEAEIVDHAGTVTARSNTTLLLGLDKPPDKAIHVADEGDVAVVTGAGGDRVRALVRLNNYPDAYLYVGRMVDAAVLAHVADTREAAQAYQALERQREQLQVKITLIYIALAILLMVVAMWFGLYYARRLAMPLVALTEAADRIGAGDMTARAPEFSRGDEFDTLGRAFNRMTTQIQQQRDELVSANREMDERRRFTETVLAGVSAGILGIGAGNRIILANASACELFGQKLETLTGLDITALLAGAGPLIEQARQKAGRIVQGELPWEAAGGGRRAFLVRVASDPAGDAGGAVLTFDDITELHAAQRKAAWADVARRIAHEIKNPLTPIQLSAERLKRKYLKQITEDRETFARCTDTIIHHVGDIGRMVNEFSAFARMPEPVMQVADVNRLVRDALVMQQEARGNIRFEPPATTIMPSRVDAQQIRQAFTNILQNAIDAIDGQVAGEPARAGEIIVRMASRRDTDEIALTVSDNGPGLPAGESVGTLTEPYVTHREKGTGLGLAIVKKIIDDHKGGLSFGVPDWLAASPGWRDPGGATVCIVLPAEKVEPLASNA